MAPQRVALPAGRARQARRLRQVGRPGRWLDPRRCGSPVLLPRRSACSRRSCPPLSGEGSGPGGYPDLGHGAPAHGRVPDRLPELVDPGRYDALCLMSLSSKRRWAAMTDWTRDMVEERVEEAAWVLGRLPGPRRQGYFSTWPDIVLQRPRDRVPGAEADAGAAVAAGDHAHGGGDHLEPVPRARRRPADVGARGGDAVEAPLLPLRHQPADRDPALRLRAQRHRLAAQRPAGATASAGATS